MISAGLLRFARSKAISVTELATLSPYAVPKLSVLGLGIGAAAALSLLRSPSAALDVPSPLAAPLERAALGGRARSARAWGCAAGASFCGRIGARATTSRMR